MAGLIFRYVMLAACSAVGENTDIEVPQSLLQIRQQQKWCGGIGGLRPPPRQPLITPFVYRASFLPRDKERTSNNFWHSTRNNRCLTQQRIAENTRRAQSQIRQQYRHMSNANWHRNARSAAESRRKAARIEATIRNKNHFVRNWDMRTSSTEMQRRRTSARAANMFRSRQMWGMRAAFGP